ncbi:S8 family serine peptidase [Chromobacterium haemolyticum]|uniref:S8 family serine peptidase n=1 Tax=Chromobacterium fluminis TaxID=3044269 RepID=A0ABX0L572_9NEIS|nr:S8 family serine peptidase [Chromobacterium haemolyticum]NHR06814.1 S8 family serine peptidase [Chromobacterium haemolyticum]
MRKNRTVLLVGAAFAALWGATLQAAPNASAQPIVVLLKSELSALSGRSQPNPELDRLQRLAPQLRPVVSPAMSRNAQKHQALARHNLTRYYLIDTHNLSPLDAQQLVSKLEQNPLVELAYIEPELEPIEKDDGELLAVSRASIPDYTNCDGANINTCQYYLYPNKPKGPYLFGGVNALEAQRLANNKGEQVRIISSEQGMWNVKHVDLPKPFLVHKLDSDGPHAHDTKSVGITVSKDNGFGTTGIVPNAQAGFSRFGPTQLIDLQNYVQAGDVVHMGAGYRPSVKPPPEVCAPDKCKLPIESKPLGFDAVSYLVQEMGVHVLLPASNGYSNLDHPYFKGDYDRKKRDSGSIYVGSAEPKKGKKRPSSNYGSRVDVFSWGADVTTTSWDEKQPNNHQLYTHSFNATSSATPIVAGGTALLQSIARARGYGNVPPKLMREILVASGQPLPFPDPKQAIGVQPDLVKALDLLDAAMDGAPLRAKITGPSETTVGDPSGLLLSAKDSTGNKLSYQWSNDSGLKLDSQKEQVLVHALPGTLAGKHTVKLVITDGKGRTAEALHLIDVKSDAEIAPPPQARLTGPDRAQAGDEVLLSAAESSGKKLKYSWKSQPTLSFTKQGAEASFIAPALTVDTNYQITVKVKDDQGRSAEASHVVKVKKQAAETPPPQAKISGPDDITMGGDPALLSAKDSSGSKLSYQWSNDSGLILSPNKEQLLVSAPRGSKEGRHKIKLVVTDSKGNTAKASHDLEVKAAANTGDVLPWDSKQVYSQPCAKVSYGGKIWFNGWSSRGDRPDLSGQWGVWRAEGSSSLHWQCKGK